MADTAIPGPFNTITDIKVANKARGHFFFEPATMRFFDSRILEGVIGGRYFVTSERFHGSNGYSPPRVYTVRVANDDGSVDSIKLHDQYATAYAARKAARKIAGV